MKLTREEVDRVIDFIRKEPRTVQDVALFIGRSWVTSDSYLEQIRTETGLIGIKTFRKGTQGAIKVAYYSHPDSLPQDELRSNILRQIQLGKRKHDFDFMELFQFVPDSGKRSFADQNSSALLKRCLSSAESSVMIFSGNLSFLSDDRLLEEMGLLLKRKVKVRILIRVNMASLGNIGLLTPLLQKYHGLIEVRHRYHPLRGIIIDDRLAVFRSEESKDFYKENELDRDSLIFYEIYDREWIDFLQKVFWNLFRPSISMAERVKELERIR